MERLYRLILLALFILGFIGAVASADRPQGISNLIESMKAAREAEAINSGRWNPNIADADSKTLDSIAQLFAAAEPMKTVGE